MFLFEYNLVANNSLQESIGGNANLAGINTHLKINLEHFLLFFFNNLGFQGASCTFSFYFLNIFSLLNKIEQMFADFIKKNLVDFFKFNDNRILFEANFLNLIIRSETFPGVMWGPTLTHNLGPISSAVLTFIADTYKPINRLPCIAYIYIYR